MDNAAHNGGSPPRRILIPWVWILTVIIFAGFLGGAYILVSHQIRLLDTAPADSSPTTVRSGQKRTNADLLYATNIPAAFRDSATFDKTIAVAGLSFLNGGLTTQGGNIDAGQGNLTAGNLIYSIAGGPGIAVSGGQHPTLTNTGVVSLNGAQGALALAAGPGIAIDGLRVSSTVSFPSLIGVGGGGTGATALTQYGVLYGNGTAPLSALEPGPTGYVLQSNGTGAAPSWVVAAGITVGSVPFPVIASGTNLTAAMLVGPGASLGFTGVGTINASSLLSGTWASPGVIGSGTANSGAFTTLLASGGLTVSSLTANGGVLYTNGSGTVAQTAAGTPGTVLHGGTLPTYGLLALGSEVSGTLPVLSGGTGATTPSTALANLGGEPVIASGTTAQYFRGDKTFQALTTAVVPEGTNLYYTQGRFDTAFSAKTTTNLAEGSSLYYTDARARSALSVSGPLAYNAATGSFSLGTVGVGSGGTGTTSFTANGLLYGNGTGALQALTPGAAGLLLQSNGSASAPSWISASGITAGSVPFPGITSGTNLTAAMLVGSGASLDVTGSGTINASSLIGGTWASPGVIGSTTPNIATFSTLTANGNEIIGGTTGITLNGTGAGISFGGSGNHAIGASAGTLQFGAVTLTGAITGNAQTITGLGTVSLATGNSYQINGASVLNATTLGSSVVTSSLTSLGTITTGTWNGTPISIAYGGTGATSFTSNGLLYGNGTSALQGTAAGTNGQLLLGVTSGAPAFATLSGDASITNAGVLTLKNTGPGAGSLGTTAAQTPIVTVDAQGRVIAVSNTAIAIDAAAITSGTLGVSRGGTGATMFTSNGVLFGNTTSPIGATAAGADGQLLLGVTAGNPAFAALSGDATITNVGVLALKNTGTANTYGSASQIPVLTTDAQGRVTGVTNTSIAIAASQITLGTLGIARGGTNNTAYTTGSVVYYDGSKLAEDNSNFFWDGTNHRLGLGTTAPLTALDIAGSASVSGGLAYRGAGTAHTTSILDGGTYNIQRSPGGSSLLSSFFIDASGNVGIGTTAPDAPVFISKSVANPGAFAAPGLAMGANGVTYSWIQSSAAPLVLNSAGGNVGIGLTNPTQKLDVLSATGETGLHLHNAAGNSGMYLLSVASDNFNVTGGAEYTGSAWVARSTDAQGIGGSGYISFFVNAGLTSGNAFTPTERMRIDTTGNVGIGTTAPGAKLDVNGTANISNTFTQSGGYAYLGSYNSALTYPRVGTDLATSWNFSNGAREITFWNTDTCNGCGDAFSFRHLTGASSQSTLMDIFPSGNVTIAGSLTQNSDQRLKTNIQALPDGDALAALNQLHPVSFNWRQVNQSTATQFGFIAQEVEKVFPQLVVTSGGPPTTIILPDGTQETYHDLKTVNYIGLVSPLVKAVQQLDGILTLQGQQVSSVAANLTAIAETQHAQAVSAGVSEQTVASLQSLADRVTALEKQVPMQASPISASLSAALTGVSLSLDKDATISGSLIVQGRTTLNDLGVTGNFTAGVLSINGMDGTIDAIGNTLKLQSLATGSIDLLAGKVIVDQQGNIVSRGEITARKVNIDESDPASASSGNGILKAGSTAVTIKTTAVHARSHFFVTPRVKTNRVLGVSTESDGVSFTVEVVDAPATDIPFDWWIVN